MTRRLSNAEREERREAYRIVRLALKSGELVRPSGCSDCPPVQAHHHLGYDHPLDIVWLCASHHGNAHREEGWRERLLATLGATE